jgi:hypothetical protein
MGMNAPAGGDRIRSRERGGIDEAASKEAIFNGRKRVGAGAEMRKPLPDPAGPRYK